MPVPFLQNSDFLQQLGNITKKYWAPALAGTVGMGALGGILASGSNPINETPRQRRRRILRAILMPSLSTAGGLAALGIGGAALNMENFRNTDPAFADKMKEVDKALNDSRANLFTTVGTPAAGLLSYKYTPKIMKSKFVSDIADPVKSLGKSGLRFGIGKSAQGVKLLNKIITKKSPAAAKLIAKIIKTTGTAASKGSKLFKDNVDKHTRLELLKVLHRGVKPVATHGAIGYGISKSIAPTASFTADKLFPKSVDQMSTEEINELFD